MALAPVPTAPEPSARPAPRGASGTSFSSGYITSQEHNTDLVGDRWFGGPSRVGVAQKMSRDGHVRRAHAAVEGPLRGALWDFNPGGDDEYATEIADACRWAFLENLNWDETVRNLCKGFRDGFSLLEVTDDTCAIPVDRFPNHPGKGFGIAPTRFAHRPAWSIIRWHPSEDNTDCLGRVTQYLSNDEAEDRGASEVDIEADRLIRFTIDQEGGDFRGLPLWRSAYANWKGKITKSIILMIGFERRGSGTPIMTVPENASDEDLDAAETILAELRSHAKGYAILPDGYELRWDVLDGLGPSDALLRAIEHDNRDIAYNVGVAFMLLGTADRTGSYSLASTQEAQYQIGLDGFATQIANCFNVGSDGWSPVRRFVHLNYGPDAPVPTLIARNMPTRSWGATLPIVKDLVGAGIVTADDKLEDHARESLYLPNRDADSARADEPADTNNNFEVSFA